MTTRATPASRTAATWSAVRKSASDLHRDRGGLGERDEEVVLAGFARSCPVEIDQMGFLRPLCGEVGEGGGGVVGVAGFAGEIALGQANAAAGDEVDGGEEDHADRNAFRNDAPGVEDRSGWNCAPHKWSCRITAVTLRVSYAARAAVAWVSGQAKLWAK